MARRATTNSPHCHNLAPPRFVIIENPMKLVPLGVEIEVGAGPCDLQLSHQGRVSADRQAGSHGPFHALH